MENREIRSKLIKMAAYLANGDHLPLREVDFHQGRYSAEEVEYLMEKAFSASKNLAVEIKRLADGIKIKTQKK